MASSHPVPSGATTSGEQLFIFFGIESAAAVETAATVITAAAPPHPPHPPHPCRALLGRVCVGRSRGRIRAYFGLTRSS